MLFTVALLTTAAKGVEVTVGANVVIEIIEPLTLSPSSSLLILGAPSTTKLQWRQKKPNKTKNAFMSVQKTNCSSNIRKRRTPMLQQMILSIKLQFAVHTLAIYNLFSVSYT